jgi:hypothetical protein
MQRDYPLLHQNSLGIPLVTDRDICLGEISNLIKLPFIERCSSLTDKSLLNPSVLKVWHTRYQGTVAHFQS